MPLLADAPASGRATAWTFIHIWRIQDGMIVGLGTGSTAKHMVRALGEKVRAGMNIRGVPTSQETATLAKESGITLIDAENR